MLILLLAKTVMELLARLGIAKFQYELALGYYTARFGEQNPEKASMWCRRAAEQGWSPAERLLATFYVAGFGVPVDQGQVFYWNQRAADHGDALGQSALAWCYQQGVGTQANVTMAFKWWLEAAQQGVPEAQYAISKCLLNGTGVSRDIPMAEQWCGLALKNGAAGAAELLRQIEVTRI